MAFPFVAALGVVSNLVSGLFGMKKQQGQVVESALDVLKNTNATDAQREQAVATTIAAEASSGYWLAAVWRPLLMLFFAGLIGARWFGYMPPNMNESELLEIYGLLKLGIGGYIGGRTVEKIIGSLGLASVMKSYIKKKLT